jgi:hypothetical protein
VRLRAGTKSRRAARSAADVAIARDMVGLSAEQCACLGDLLASKPSCILPASLPCLSISSLCFLLAPLAQHPDLLRRWKTALHAACEAVSVARRITPVNWNDLCQKVLEPAIRKPLNVHFVITCLDFSWNIDSLVAVRPLAPPLDHLSWMTNPVSRPVVEW